MAETSILSIFLVSANTFFLPHSQNKNTLLFFFAANVHLLTLETMDDGVLIRVEHQFEKDEDPKFSQPVTVKLDNLFTRFKITSLTEMNLAANQLLSDKETFYWKAEEPENNQFAYELPNTIGDGYEVTLNPMQIRTFKATIAPSLRNDNMKI